MRVLTTIEMTMASGGASLSNNGFAAESGQGNLDNTNVKGNNGTTTESGPKGVLKNGNTDNPNYVLDLPGAKR